MERRSNASGRELGAAEREAAIEDYVRDEIRLREAHRNGRHLENSRVRQRLILAMRTALNEAVPDPSLEQLRAYFQANADRYRIPESISFSHVFLEKGSAAPASEIRRQLDLGADFESLGQTFWLGSTMERQTRPRLVGAFGESFADTVADLTPGIWSDAIESNRGVHFVRISERHLPALPDFETVQRFVRVDWITERGLEIQERKMARIPARYTVVSPSW